MLNDPILNIPETPPIRRLKSPFFTATLTLVDVESIIGGSGTDTITLGTNATNTHTISAIEGLVGNAGSDLITLSATITALDFNGTGGNDSLTLAAGGNTATLTLTGVESVIGGSGIDIISLVSATGINVNLVESGAAAADVLTVTAAVVVDVIAAGDGDKIVYLLELNGEGRSARLIGNTLAGKACLDRYQES